MIRVKFGMLPSLEKQFLQPEDRLTALADWRHSQSTVALDLTIVIL